MKRKILSVICVLMFILINGTVLAKLDQYQTQDMASRAFTGTTWLAQSFTPTVSTLTKIELKIHTTTGYDHEVFVSIGTDLNSPYLTTVTKRNTEGWTEFDFDDFDIIPGEKYYIVVRSDPDSPTQSIWWYYGYNNYDRGKNYVSYNSGIDWDICTEDYDFCFKTYGDPPFNPDFEWDLQNPTAAIPIQFTDKSYGSTELIESWHWDFGDGQTSTLQNPIHQYSESGKYDVTLTIANQHSEETVTKEVAIGKLVEIKVQDSNGNWVSNIDALGQDKIKFKITVYNNETDKDIDPRITNELPSFLKYNGDATPDTPTKNGNVLTWEKPNWELDPNSKYEIIYTATVENQETTGFNIVNVELEPPQSNEKNTATNKPIVLFLKNMINRLQERRPIIKILEFFKFKLSDFLQEKSLVTPSTMLANNIPLMYSDQVSIHVIKNEPDLICNGSIEAPGSIKIGESFTDTFEIKNDGKAGSKLDLGTKTKDTNEVHYTIQSREITSGKNGKDITPDDGWLTVEVVVTVNWVAKANRIYDLNYNIYDYNDDSDFYEFTIPVEVLERSKVF